jgi:DNA-binding beta-propeller fold protein YncE
MAGALTGCAETPSEVAQIPKGELVWPSPPATPRIKFIQAFSTAEEAGISRSRFRKFVDFIVGAPSRKIQSPYGIAKDPEGRVYVVDTFYKCVHVFDRPGSAYYWFPKAPVKTFVNPIGVAAGADGRVYVSDSQSRVVHVFGDHGKTYLTALGKAVLKRPTGLALDSTGHLLVVDTLASQVLVFDTAGYRQKAVIGQDGRGEGAFHYPTSISLAHDGKVLVSDSLNFRVSVLSPELAFQKAFGEAGDAPGYFARPKGIAADSEGHVYVVDALFDNVQIFDQEGRLLLAFGSPGRGPGEFWLPNEIFIDDQDRIYVSDAYNKRVQIFQYLKAGSKH